jgi:hypothetical protein
MPLQRKQPSRVLSMSGEDFSEDVITEKDYKEAVSVQDAVLFAQADERRVLGKLRVRIERGATESCKRYYFDQARGIVRRRGKSEAG